jgi:pimeloyl-ACP methyl ester carboxylesterase
MAGLEQLTLRGNGLNLHAVAQGKGPVVLLVHGFPGLSYSWRHQMAAIADAGWRAVAIDLRGFGRSDAPKDPALYHWDAVGPDITGVIDSLGEEKVVIVGHDFGSNLTWHMGQRNPERFLGLCVTSAPFNATPIPIRPTDAFRMAAEQSFLHMHYFQEVGPADRELDANPAGYIGRLYWALSGQCGHKFAGQDKNAKGYIDVLPEHPPLPWKWMSQAEFDHYIAEYKHAGFTGGLNWYRAFDANWEIAKRFEGKKLPMPTLFISGAQDTVIRDYTTPESVEAMKGMMPDLRGFELIPNAGHFVQMEQAEAFNKVLLKFLGEIKPRK